MKDQRPPIKLFFEYNRSKNKKENLVTTYFSFKHRTPNHEHHQQKEATPKYVEIEPDFEDEQMLASKNQAGASVFCKDWLYITVQDNDAS